MNLWFYFSALAVAIGACVNGELEVIEPSARQVRRETA